MTFVRRNSKFGALLCSHAGKKMIRVPIRTVNLIAVCMMDGTNLRDYGCLLLTTAEAKGLKLFHRRENARQEKSGTMCNKMTNHF